MLTRLILAASLALGGCTLVERGGDEFRAPNAPAPIITPDDVAHRHIDAGDVRRHIAFLASDSRRGRATPSPGLERSAAWIAEEFHRSGLEPAGDSSGYLQYWPYERTGLSVAEASVVWGDGAGALEYGRDFAALPSPRGGDGPLVYLGRAEDAPDSMAVASGKTAVVLLEGATPDQWRWPITVRRSLITANRAAALGIIFVLDPEFDEAAIGALVEQFEIPADKPQAVPLFFVRSPAAAALIEAAGGDLAALRTATESGDRTPVLLDRVSTRVAAPSTEMATEVPNVVGLLPGSDPSRAEEYVVVVAHYDHLGVGEPDESGDSIYNGADDNASGVAALLEVAQAFGELRDPPARPVLFLAVSGEEQGLLGSTWYASNPTVFLSDAVGVLNMDMVGRNHPDTVAVIGYGLSGLGPLIGEVAAATPALGLHLVADPYPGQNLFQRSDHFAFARRGIPAIAVSSGLHDDYHRPSDEPGKIDEDKAARIARLVFLTAQRLAAGESVPEWTEEGRAAIRR